MTLPFSITVAHRGKVPKCIPLGNAVNSQVDYIVDQLLTPKDAMKILGVRSQATVTGIAKKYHIKNWTRSSTTLFYKPHVEQVARWRMEAAKENGLGELASMSP